MKGLYNAPLAYNRLRNGYHYTQQDYSIKGHALTNEEVEALDFSTAIFQQLKGTKMFMHLQNAINKLIEVHRISKIIGKSESQILQIEEPLKVEDNGYLEIILKAILQKECLRVNYQPFNKELKEHHFSPYILKEHHNRWYAVGFSGLKGDVLTFGLDRIVDINKSNEKYKSDPHFDADAFFKHALGIIQRHTKKPQKIVLWLSKEQAPYVLSQPLHQSQKLIKRVDGDAKIELALYLTQELNMTILSYGKDAKVISPPALQKEIKEIIEKMRKSYE